MLFSIVIPVHNGERYLSECIDSALSQSADFAQTPEQEYEIIVVENGSVDRTLEIAEKYAEQYPNVRCIKRGSIGLYAARQEGFREAEGEWVLSLDADDKLLPNMLSTLSGFIKETEQSPEKCDLILFDAAGMGHPDIKLNSLPFESGKICQGADKDIFKEVICRGDEINAMWIKCIRRSLAYLDEEILGLNYGEDLMQTACYIDKAEGIVYLDDTLYLYRENEASLSATYNKAYLENQKIVWSKIDYLVDKWGVPAYLDNVKKRKALTCSIAAGKIMYSKLRAGQKKEELRNLMEDSFYKEYALYELPKWAPEETVFIHRMQVCDRAFEKMIANARKSDFKAFVKGIIS